MTIRARILGTFAALMTVALALVAAVVGRRQVQLDAEIVLVMVAVVLLGTVTALVLSRFVVAPIEKLTRDVRALERGEVETVSMNATGEVRDLAESINRMRADVTASYDEIERSAGKARTRADKLERANVELDRFAYAASHDLRAPLRGISNLSEFISEDIRAVEGVSEDVHDNLELLRRRVQRLDDLLMSLLEYSRVGRESMGVEEVDTRDLAGYVVDLLAIPKGFNVKIDPGLPLIDAQRLPLQRVFTQLIDNAIKHHDRDTGEIEVGYISTEQYEVFTITDDGPGIPVHLQKKAFQIFSTLKRRDEVEGSGMGLALIRKIVKNAGGLLTLESQGRGCKFIVRWPRETEEEDQTMINMRALVERED